MSEQHYNKEVSMNVIEDRHLHEICLLTQKEKTCAYLAMGPKGFMCAKGTVFQREIERRIHADTMSAKGDNCGGWKGNESTTP